MCSGAGDANGPRAEGLHGCAAVRIVYRRTTHDRLDRNDADGPTTSLRSCSSGPVGGEFSTSLSDALKELALLRFGIPVGQEHCGTDTANHGRAEACQRVVQRSVVKELELVVLRHELAVASSGPSTGASASRPMLPGGGQPTVATRQVVGVSGHAGDAPALASLDGGPALDLCATAWSSADRQRASSTDRSLGTGESAVGLSAHCGRAEGPRHCPTGHHGQEDPPGGTTRSSRQAQRSIMA
jgi:hypothetical protein